MSRIDPECFPQGGRSGKKVCHQCFSDTDLIELIETYETSGNCSYCRQDEAFIAPLSEIAAFIRSRLESFYSLAVDHLPYESREGGYQGRHEDTYDCLYESVGLELTSDGERDLRWELVNEVGDEIWCDYDWLSLDIDQSLLSSWEHFCSVTKSQRRFFFHRFGENNERHPDERSVFEFLRETAHLIEHHELVRDLPEGTDFFRARPNSGGCWTTASELGPPPAGFALQSNRMNPPGIPMFYGASNASLALAETRAQDVTVGTFSATRPIRVVDLAHLPPVPGFFSEAPRAEIKTLVFLHLLSRRLADPVEQSNRVNVDYIPTQIITEFLRDYPFSGGGVDGIQYVTTLPEVGFNTVLFATQDNVADEGEHDASSRHWLCLTNTQLVSVADSSE